MVMLPLKLRVEGSSEVSCDVKLTEDRLHRASIVLVFHLFPELRIGAQSILEGFGYILLAACEPHEFAIFRALILWQFRLYIMVQKEAL